MQEKQLATLLDELFPGWRFALPQRADCKSIEAQSIAQALLNNQHK